MEHTLGDFHWIEIPWERRDIPSVVRPLASAVIGLAAANVSWDSGRMIPTSEQEVAGWQCVGEIAVSPVITAALAADWPISHDGGKYDEWYFFRNLEGAPKLEAFSKWMRASLEEALDPGIPERVRSQGRAWDKGHEGDEEHEGGC